jgi:hypothetical protein
MGRGGGLVRPHHAPAGPVPCHQPTSGFSANRRGALERRGSSGREPAGRAAGQPLRDPRRAHQHPQLLLVCLWDGYGWLHGGPSVAILGPRGSVPVPPAFPAQVLDGPRVRLPGRDYLLFAGPVAAAPQLGWTDPNGLFWPQSPNLFWPHDHAWCVASEIDLFCTLVAGSDELAEALVGDPRLEAWPVQPTDPIAFDSDQINT